MKQNNDLKNLSIEELNEKLLALRKDQLNLRLKKAAGALDKTHLITQVRKAIARVKTLITQKVGK